MPDLIKLLPWKLEEVDIPDQSLSSGSFVSSPKEALYRLYQRKGRKDIISIIKTKDFIKDIKYWILK